MKTLEELALLYQGGNDEALAEIFRRGNGIIRSISRKYFLIGAETEDVYQEGVIGLLNAAKSYKPGKSSFNTYAAHCVRNSIITAIRRYSNPQSKILSDGLPLDEADGNTVYDPEEIFIEGESSRELIAKIDNKLSPFERQVLDLFLSGSSYAEMREITGKKTKSIDNALQRIRKKLRKVLN